MELYMLKDFWLKFNRFWVSESNETLSLISQSEKIYNAYFPTNRSIKNLMKNTFLAFKILIREKPSIIISTGAGVCVPFFYVGRLFKVKTIYVESLTRVKDLSLTGKLVYPVASVFFVQWPELAEKYKKAKFVVNKI